MRPLPDALVAPPVASLERALVERARAGDARAFRTIFEQHAPAVRRLLRDLCRDPGAADEATQETFVRAHGRLLSMRDADRLRPWLLGIARNVFLEQARARRRGRAADETEAVALPDRAPSPEAQLLGREAQVELGRALAVLGEERRTALLLRVDHDLGYDEIAQVMGWSLAKVKNEIHRARLEVRAALGTYLGGQS